MGKMRISPRPTREFQEIHHAVRVCQAQLACAVKGFEAGEDTEHRELAGSALVVLTSAAADLAGLIDRLDEWSTAQGI
jgi:hypothetical protein